MSGFIGAPGSKGSLRGDEDDAGRFETEGAAVEAAVAFHPRPALGPEHAEELVRRVQPDLERLEGLLRTLEGPVLPDAARGEVEGVLDAHGPLGDGDGLLAGKLVNEVVSVPRIEHEDPARPERGAEAVHEETVLVVGEVPDAREEVQREVELAWEIHVAHVLLDEGEREPGGGGARPRAAQLGLRQIHAGHREAAPGEREGVSPEAARRVQDATGRRRADVVQDPRDLRLGGRLGLEALRDLGPRFEEETLAVEHEAHYTQTGGLDRCRHWSRARSAASGRGW